MKYNFIGTLLSFVFILFLSGCTEEDTVTTPANIQFASESYSLAENESTLIIPLELDRPATVAGSISIKISSLDEQRFSLSPSAVNNTISLIISEEQQSASISITPINNTIDESHINVQLEITKVSEGLSIARKRTTIITVTDEDSPNQSPLPLANLTALEERIGENQLQGLLIPIVLSSATTSPGTLVISAESIKAVAGVHYRTEPQTVNGAINLSIPAGASQASFTIIPIDNNIIGGELELNLQLEQAWGGVTRGTVVQKKVIIRDDELYLKPKGFQISGSAWSLKNTQEYDEQGRISKVIIEEAFPTPVTRTETYFYNSDGLLNRKNLYPGSDVTYTWTNDRITRSKTISNNIITRYTDFDYDSQGNVSGTATYFRQQDGTMALSIVVAFLYYLDGNLYKSLHYTPLESGELVLNATRTYEHYLPNNNPFGMVDILPTVRPQKKLPTRYTVQEGGKELTYTFKL